MLNPLRVKSETTTTTQNVAQVGVNSKGAIMSKLIRLPWKFYIDHSERGLPTPDDVKSTDRHVYVSADDPHLNSLRTDAEYYAHKFAPDLCSASIKASAKATLTAINKATEVQQ